MSTDEKPTWYAVERDAIAAATEWAETRHSHDDAIDDAARDYADSTDTVIYTWRARTVWMDSPDVQACEDSFDFAESDDIDRRITLCVYLAIFGAFADAAREAIAKRDEVTA